jgi:hypothetical protein
MIHRKPAAPIYLKEGQAYDTSQFHVDEITDQEPAPIVIHPLAFDYMMRYLVEHKSHPEEYVFKAPICSPHHSLMVDGVNFIRGKE